MSKDMFSPDSGVETVFELPKASPLSLESFESPSPSLSIQNIRSSYDLSLMRGILQIDPSAVGDNPELKENCALLQECSYSRLVELAKAELAPNPLNPSSSAESAVGILLESFPRFRSSQKQAEVCRLFANHPEYADALVEMMFSPYSEVRNASGIILGNMTTTEDGRKVLLPEIETKILALKAQIPSHPNLCEPICYSLFYSKSPEAKALISQIEHSHGTGQFQYLAARITSQQMQE